MLALIRMDWTLNRRMFLQLTPLFALWACMLPMGERGPALFFFPTATLLMLVPLFQQLNRPFEGYLLALPVDRVQVMAVRYVSALAGLLAAGLLTLLLHRVLGQVPAFRQGLMARGDVLEMLGMQAWCLVAVVALFLPFHARFASDRAVIAFLATLLGGFLAWCLLEGWSSLVARVWLGLGRALEGGPLGPLAILALLVAASLGISLGAARARQRELPFPAWLPPGLVLAALAAAALALHRLPDLSRLGG